MQYLSTGVVRNLQDLVELHLFETVEYDNDIMFVYVKGTGTQDPKIPVINTGYSFNLPDNTNSEVLLLSNGSNVNDKLAIMLIPRDKQRQWKKRTGGIQSPEDKNKAIEFNPIRTHIRSENIALGNEGQIEINGHHITIRGNVTVEGNLNVTGHMNVMGSITCNGTGSFATAVNTNFANVGAYAFDPTVEKVLIRTDKFEDYKEDV